MALIDTNIVSSQGRSLVPDTDALTRTIGTLLRDKKNNDRQDARLQQIQKAKQAKQIADTEQAQWLRIRNIEDFQEQRREIAIQGQKVAREGRDSSAYTQALSETTPTRLNLAITRAATAKGNASKMISLLTGGEKTAKPHTSIAKARADLKAGLITQEDFNKLQRDPANTEANAEFLKEERKNASQDVRKFNTQAKEMRTSYAKLQGLAKQARSGDRGARNAMTVAVGRLMSPGIFTETEASALSGGQNTLQAVLAAMAGKGLNTDAIQRNIDPYGDNFNVDGLLDIGSSIVASSKQPLIDMYEGSRDRATTSAMSQRAFETNFGKNANYDFLLNFNQSTSDGLTVPDGWNDLSPEEQTEYKALEAKHDNR